MAVAPEEEIIIEQPLIEEKEELIPIEIIALLRVIDLAKSFQISLTNDHFNILEIEPIYNMI